MSATIVGIAQVVCTVVGAVTLYTLAVAACWALLVRSVRAGPGAPSASRSGRRSTRGNDHVTVIDSPRPWQICHGRGVLAAEGPAEAPPAGRWRATRRAATRDPRASGSVRRQAPARSRRRARGDAPRGGAGGDRSPWTCPRCGNSFVTRNQYHSCARHDLAEPFAGRPAAVRELFERLREMVEECGPVTVVPWPS